MTVLLVAVGGVVGVLGRYALGTTVSPETLPWVTVGINVVGSLLLGLVASLGGGLGPEVRSAIAVGVLGGFTTFSTFSVDVLIQLEAGEGGRAVLYLIASVGLGIGAAAAGYYTGRAMT